MFGGWRSRGYVPVSSTMMALWVEKSTYHLGLSSSDLAFHHLPSLSFSPFFECKSHSLLAFMTQVWE